MSNTINSQRYHNVELRDKLAGEYVLGTQTPRVRRRLEALMKADPSWWEHVEQWQQNLSSITPSSDLSSSSKNLKRPPKRVWKKIVNSTFGFRKRKSNLGWWLPAGMAFSLFVGMFIQSTLMNTPTGINVTEVRPANYLAMMSSGTQKDHFALVAYQGDRPGQSSLRMQRNVSMDRISDNRAMVWMRDGPTGELILIDSLKNVSDIRYMSPKEWQTLKSSSELIVTANRDPDSEVLYRGRCVELSDWHAM
ncbi:hypothetical protein ACEI16_001946 [Vibrio fluvialis]|uniref:hypothetical protein n=1 Tax=Vibrio fluvialis TaxID=676 RepID=UPI001EECB76E|nr:hypothetical protein [Vibrio fluvialis]ELE5892064.1 hypothetical protein [Vibrio fluvialis]MCG6350378.1 hypothetical protein [Vibrio fluvialis]